MGTPLRKLPCRHQTSEGVRTKTYNSGILCVKRERERGGGREGGSGGGGKRNCLYKTKTSMATVFSWGFGCEAWCIAWTITCLWHFLSHERSLWLTWSWLRPLCYWPLWLNVNRLKELLMTMGDRFTEDEVKFLVYSSLLNAFTTAVGFTYWYNKLHNMKFVTQANNNNIINFV